MFSVIQNTQAATASGSSPTTTMQDQFREQVIQAYDNVTVLSKMNGLFHSEQAQQGKNAVVYTIRGRSSTSRATKAAGELPQQGIADSLNISLTYDAAEYLDQPYDKNEMGDARYQLAAQDASNEVIRAVNDEEIRIMHALWKTAQLTALTGYLQAPVLKTISASVSGNDVNQANAFPLSDTGAELAFKTITQVKTLTRFGSYLTTTAVNRDNTKGSGWMWVMRPEMFDALKFGTRTSSNQYNAGGGSMLRGLVPMIDGDPIVVSPAQFWPRTNYTDQSFSRYNTNGIVTSTNGMPVAYYLNYGNGVSPIAQTLPPSEGGITVKMLDEPFREAMIARVKSRYSYDTYRRDAMGCISIKQ